MQAVPALCQPSVRRCYGKGCVFPLLHAIFTAHHCADHRRTKEDFREVGIVLSISSAHKTNCGVGIKFLMALTDKQAQNRLNSASCFETEHEITVPKPHQHKAHLRSIKKIKRMSWISQRQKTAPSQKYCKDVPFYHDLCIRGNYFVKWILKSKICLSLCWRFFYSFSIC